MRQSALFSILTLGLLLVVPPVHAVNYTGEAVLKLNTLQLSGIPVKVEFTNQETEIRVIAGQPYSEEKYSENYFSGSPGLHTFSSTIPGVATATSTTASNQLATSVNVFGPGLDLASAATFHIITFEALASGQLTATVDYALQQTGSLPTSHTSGFTADEGAGLMFLYPIGFPGPASGDSLSSISGTHAGNGELSVTESVPKGADVQLFLSDSVYIEHRVPIPDMLWPTLLGMIGIAFWAERRRRQAGLTP